MSLKDARTEAIRLLSGDQRPAASSNPKQAIEAFLDYCEQRNRPRTVKDYKRLLNRHFPRSFDRTAIMGKFDGLRKTPGEQSHATAAFQVFLNWCVHNGILEHNPIAGFKNLGRIGKRDRVLTPEELHAVWDAFTDDRFGIIVRTMILTGQRKGEVPYITIDGDTATIPSERTKNKRRHEFRWGR